MTREIEKGGAAARRRRRNCLPAGREEVSRDGPTNGSRGLEGSKKEMGEGERETPRPQQPPTKAKRRGERAKIAR